MNTKFSISIVEVKICPDCGVEHISDMEQCDICIMAAEIETIESEQQTIFENRIKAFEI